MAAYVTQSDVESVIGVTAVRDLCDDDGDGVADSSIVTTMIAMGSGVARGLLLPGFLSDIAVTNICTDDDVKRAICCVVAETMGRRRPEFIDAAGKGRYDAIGATGREVLKAIGKGQERAGQEMNYGKNTTLGGSSNTTMPVVHVIAPSRTRVSGHGGF